MFLLDTVLAGRQILRSTEAGPKAGSKESWVKGERTESRKEMGWSQKITQRQWPKEGPGPRWTVGWCEETGPEFCPSLGASSTLPWGQEYNPRHNCWACIWKQLTRWEIWAWCQSIFRWSFIKCCSSWKLGINLSWKVHWKCFNPKMRF